jgi:hypothetical protein
MGTRVRTTGKSSGIHRKVKLRGINSSPGSVKNRDKGIYLGGELVGVVVCHTRSWRVWRVISNGEASCGKNDYGRMYTDRFERLGGFDTWRQTRKYVKGPLSDSLIEEPCSFKSGKEGSHRNIPRHAPFGMVTAGGTGRNTEEEF